MRTLVILIIQFLFVRQIAFSQNGESQSSNLSKYPLKTVIDYCQHDTLNAISKMELTYNENKVLIKSVSFFLTDTTVKWFREYSYNDKELLSSIYSYELSGNTKSREYKLVFNYNTLLQLTSEFYENNTYNPRQDNIYDNKGQLIKRTVSGKDWRQEFTFEYDALGRLIKKDRGNSTFSTYEYSASQLKKEVDHNANQNNIEETIYEYNNMGLMVNKIESGKTVVRNIYKDGLLIQRWTNYYGIDPCIEAPCCSQHMTKFVYY